jgi:chromosome segregation ATPase
MVSTLKEQLKAEQGQSDRAKGQVAAKESEILDLRSQLSRLQRESEAERREFFKSVETKQAATLLQLEEEVESLRRDNAKLSVELRQVSKENERMKKSAEQEKSARTEYYEDKMSQKDEEIRNLRKERSTLLAALREVRSPDNSADRPTLQSRASEHRTLRSARDPELRSARDPEARDASNIDRRTLGTQDHRSLLGRSEANRAVIADSVRAQTVSRPSRSFSPKSSKPPVQIRLRSLAELANQLLSDDEDEQGMDHRDVETGEEDFQIYPSD